MGNSRLVDTVSSGSSSIVCYPAITVRRYLLNEGELDLIKDHINYVLTRQSDSDRHCLTAYIVRQGRPIVIKDSWQGLCGSNK